MVAGFVFLHLFLSLVFFVYNMYIFFLLIQILFTNKKKVSLWAKKGKRCGGLLLMPFLDCLEGKK